MLATDIQKQSVTWVISTDKAGHVNQCLTLCKLLNWPIDQIIKVPGASASDSLLERLSKNFKRLLAVRKTLARQKPAEPYIRIVASGQSSERVVAHFREIYGDRLFSIFVGSPKLKQNIFDIAVASLHEVVNGVYPSYPSARQTAWISGVLAASIERAENSSPLPLVAVLIGGVNKGYDLPVTVVEKQVEKILAQHPTATGDAVVVFSRRTPIELEVRLRQSFAHAGIRFVGRDDRDGFLDTIRKADHFYVTPDSITMICEAVSTGMPVSIFDLPVKDQTASAVRFAEEEIIRGRIFRIGQDNQADVVASDDGVQAAVGIIEKNLLKWWQARDETQSRLARRIWVLTGGRVGDFKQMQALAANLEGQVTIKQLSFHKFLFRLPTAMIPWLLTAQSRQILHEPPPDLVISAESRASAVAVKIKKRHPKTKLVCLTRPRGGFSWFDLIVTTPQFGLPKASNIVEIELPLTVPQASSQEPASAKNKNPHIALLVGGESAPHVMNRQVATDMCKQVEAYVKEKNGFLLCSTSARTGREVEDVLAEHFGSNRKIFLWSQGGSDNPYARFLAEADEFIVTADSVSMVADAVATGKPVMIYALPTHWSRSRRYIQSLWRIASRQPPSLLSATARLLFEWGIFEPAVNRAALYQRLKERDLVSPFGAKNNPSARERVDDMARVIQRINNL